MIFAKITIPLLWCYSVCSMLLDHKSDSETAVIPKTPPSEIRILGQNITYSDSDILIHVCTIDVSDRRIDDISQLIDRIMDRLRVYADHLFDVQAFDTEAEGIKIWLAKAEEFVATIATCDGDLLKRYRFASEVFTEMCISSEAMKYFEASCGPDHLLVHHVIHLNLALYQFYDSQGRPISRIGNHDEALSEYSKFLKDWEDFFANMIHASFSVESMFRLEVSKARSKLKELMGYSKIAPNLRVIY